jgi:hypothetical protein
MREVHANHVETSYLKLSVHTFEGRGVIEEIFPARTFAESIDLLDGVCLGACGGGQRQYLVRPNNS